MRGVTVLLILSSFITGCGGYKNSSGKGAAAAPPLVTDWVPEKIEIRCAKDITCPPQVGLLIFVFPEVEGVHKIRKCTAFQTAAKQIMSNGHCDFSVEAQGYFITALTSPVGRQVRKVTRVIAKKFTPHRNAARPDLDSGRPDAATFELDAPVRQTPLALAALNDPPYEKLIGFVLNPAPNNNYVIDRVDCDVRRHEAFFPYNLGDNPDVLTVYNCATRKGNSGGPLFAPGSAKVQAIGQGSGDPSETQRRLNRPLRNFETHWSVKATNARCLDAPADVCKQVDESGHSSRFTELQRKASEERGGGELEFNEWAEILPTRR